MKVVMVKDLSDYFGKNISLVKQDFPNGMVVYGLVADFSSYDLNWVSFSFDALCKTCHEKREGEVLPNPG